MFLHVTLLSSLVIILCHCQNILTYIFSSLCLDELANLLELNSTYPKYSYISLTNFDYATLFFKRINSHVQIPSHGAHLDLDPKNTPKNSPTIELSTRKNSIHPTPYLRSFQNKDIFGLDFLYYVQLLVICFFTQIQFKRWLQQCVQSCGFNF